MKPRRAFGDPAQECRKARMGAQGRDGVKVAGKLGLGQGGVNFVVTDLMQEHGRPVFATLEAGDQVMLALAGIGRNWAVAERANRV